MRVETKYDVHSEVWLVTVLGVSWDRVKSLRFILPDTAAIYQLDVRGTSHSERDLFATFSDASLAFASGHKKRSSEEIGDIKYQIDEFDNPQLLEDSEFAT